MRYPSILPPGYLRPRQIVANLIVPCLRWSVVVGVTFSGRLGILMYHKYQEPHRLPTQEKLREEARSHNPAINQVYMKSLNLDMALNNAEMADVEHLFDPPPIRQRALVLQKLALPATSAASISKPGNTCIAMISPPSFEVRERN